MCTHFVSKLYSLCFSRQFHNFKSKSGMFEAYVLVNIARLLAPHATVRALKSRRAAAFEFRMSYHVIHILIALIALRTHVPNKFIPLCN